MSEIASRFLRHLQEDIQQLCDPDCPVGDRLRELSLRLDVVDVGGGHPIAWDKDQGRVLIDLGHPAVKTLINSPARRRTDLVFFISSLVSLLNREEAEITDEHERVFHAKLLRFALENSQGSWTASAPT